MKLVTLFNPVPLASDPQVAEDGALYFNSVSGKYRYYFSGLWSDVDSSQGGGGGGELFAVGSASVTSFSHQLIGAYAGNSIVGYSASASTFLAPIDDTISAGTKITIIRGGPGEISIQPSGSASVSSPSDVYLVSVNTSVDLIKLSSNNWIVSGSFPDIY